MDVLDHSDIEIMSVEDDFSYDNNDDFDDDDSDFGENENIVIKKSIPKVKKTASKKVIKKSIPKVKKTASKKKVPSSSNALAEIDLNEENQTTPLAEEKGKKGKSKKTVEETYQKKSQLEHILIRPDTYIGSVEQIEQNMYVLNDNDDIVEKKIMYTPGLYKIYDEILVNAADNKQRDPNMDKMDIEINAELNLISVKNNGKGIPVVMHKEHNCYVPTLIFGK